MEDMERKYWGVYYELRDLKQKTEWISVDDPPESKVSVLVHDERGDIYTTSMSSGGRFWSWDDVRVTHWMPLPELPESEVK